jgi:hypothetical protein
VTRFLAGTAGAALAGLITWAATGSPHWAAVAAVLVWFGDFILDDLL